MYDDEPAEDASVDERLLLMQQYVDLDNARKKMDKERKFLEEKHHKLTAEFRQVAERLRNRMGFEDPMEQAKRSLSDEAARLR